MKGLETGKDKIQKICDALKKETLEPAKQEAREIVENAHIQASEVLKEAQAKADSIMQDAEKEIEGKKKVFEASLTLACRQGMESLRQKIEKELFSEELTQLIGKEMADPKVIVNLLNSFMKTMEEKGVDEDFIASIPKSISPRIINDLLASKVLQKLENQTVIAGDFAGGLQIQLKDAKVTVDISDTALRAIVAQYIRKDLRDLVFNV
jgi:V/A-type H+-transporting ATPase subunit E